jgi:hypothetical protein
MPTEIWIYFEGQKTHSTAWNILLRDSEGPYHPSRSPSDSIFWMAEMFKSLLDKLA